MTANVSTVNLSDGRVVTLSYGVAVAVFVPSFWSKLTEGTNHHPTGYLKTDRKYSTTSSRHAGLYARQNGSEARTVPHAEFRELVSPVQTEA